MHPSVKFSGDFAIQEIAAPANLPHCKAYMLDSCSVFVGKEPVTERGIVRMRWHLSISNRKRYTNWNEIKAARYELVPHDVTMAMILPPPTQYVNLDSNCFHLHEIDGEA